MLGFFSKSELGFQVIEMWLLPSSLAGIETEGEGGDGLEGEDVHVLHAEGHVEDADVEALLEGDLEGEALYVLHA